MFVSVKRCHCGEDEQSHQELGIIRNNPSIDWVVDYDTKRSSTDAFGEILFHRYAMKSSTAKVNS